MLSGRERDDRNPVPQVGAERNADAVSGQILVRSGNQGDDVGRGQDRCHQAPEHPRLSECRLYSASCTVCFEVVASCICQMLVVQSEC